MQIRRTLPIVFIAVILFWVLLITVFPVYLPQARGFGFVFPFFFFPFFGGRRYGRRTNPTSAPPDNSENKKKDDFEYLDVFENESYKPTFAPRNYLLYIVAGSLFALGIYLAVTKVF